jgi:uncharacterized SAM-binding protein YcdF (DUF218 family)
MISSIKRLLRSRRLWRGVRLMLALWLVGVVVLIVAIVIYSGSDQAQEADVIVILGAGLDRRDRPGPALVRRAAQGAALWEDGKASRIICSGGYGLNRSRSEADACAELLRDEGVPDNVILLEDRSRSTEENAMYTLEMMQANGWQTAVIVSDGYHLLRAHWIFNSAGIPNYPSPAENPPAFNLLASTAREVVAFHWLAFKTVFNIPVTYIPVL